MQVIRDKLIGAFISQLQLRKARSILPHAAATGTCDLRYQNCLHFTATFSSLGPGSFSPTEGCLDNAIFQPFGELYSNTLFFWVVLFFLFQGPKHAPCSWGCVSVREVKVLLSDPGAGDLCEEELFLL